MPETDATKKIDPWVQPLSQEMRPAWAYNRLWILIYGLKSVAAKATTDAMVPTPVHSPDRQSRMTPKLNAVS